MPLLRTLLLDNYDSYTYNLVQLIADVTRGALTECLQGAGARAAAPGNGCPLRLRRDSLAACRPTPCCRAAHGAAQR